MHVCKYKINKTIFIECDDGIGIVLILSRKVNIKFCDTVLAELNDGDFLEEVALSSLDRQYPPLITEIITSTRTQNKR